VTLLVAAAASLAAAGAAAATLALVGRGGARAAAATATAAPPPAAAAAAPPPVAATPLAAARPLGLHAVDSAYPLGAAVVAPRRDAAAEAARRLELGGGGGGGGGGSQRQQQASPTAFGADGDGGDDGDDGAGGARRTVIVGVAGASGSGKTSIATLIQASLAASARTSAIRVRGISCDAYYRGLPPGVNAAVYNWDHPSALDLDLLAADLRRLRQGEDVHVPQYCFTTHRRLPESTQLRGCETDVLILDGIFVLYSEAVRLACDVTIFTAEDLDVCLARRLRRDVVERGRTVESVLEQWSTFVKPGFRQFVEPSLTSADLIIPRARDNATAIKMLSRDIERRVHGYTGALSSPAGGGARTFGGAADAPSRAVSGEGTPLTI
jgi:uridine kinase